MPFDRNAWFRYYKHEPKPPRVVRLTGETVGDASVEVIGELPDVVILTARDLFALEIERDYWRKHPDKR